MKTINKKVKIEVPVEIIIKKYTFSSAPIPVLPYHTVGWKFSLEDKSFGDYVYVEDDFSKEQEAVYIKDALDQAREGLKEACSYTLPTYKLERVLLNRLEDFYNHKQAYKRWNFYSRVKIGLGKYLLKLILRGK
jgi:hypothetical protein